MEIKVKREIRSYNEALFLGLSLWQLVFSALAILVAVGVSFSLRSTFSLETLSWLCNQKDIFLTSTIHAECDIRNGVHALLFLLCGVRHRPWPGSYKSDTILCKMRLSVKRFFLYDMSDD